MKKLKPPSEKNFGITFSIILLLIFIYLLYNKSFNLYVLLISIILLFVSFVAPQILKIPNVVWFRFGIVLSKIMTPLILTLIFFIVFGPISILRKITTLHTKSKFSSWKKSNKDYKIDFKKQF